MFSKAPTKNGKLQLIERKPKSREYVATFRGNRPSPEETFRGLGVVMVLTSRSMANPSASKTKLIRSFPVKNRLQNMSPKITKMKPTSKILIAPKTRDEADAATTLILFFFPLASRTAKHPGTNGRTHGEAKMLTPKISEINNAGDSDAGRKLRWLLSVEELA
jgi:hypothetical protein